MHENRCCPRSASPAFHTGATGPLASPAGIRGTAGTPVSTGRFPQPQLPGAGADGDGGADQSGRADGPTQAAERKEVSGAN